MTEQRSPRFYRNLSLGICAVSEFIVAVAWLNSGEFFGAEGSIWLCLLFGMPGMIQVMGLWHLNSKIDSNHRLRSETGVENTDAEPDVEQLKALASYYKFYLITMSICLLTYSALWLIYVYAQRSYGWETATWDKGLTTMTAGWSRIFVGLSVYALITISLLLGLVLWMTRAIIGENKIPTTRWEFLNPQHLKRGAAEAPFLTLIFFMTVFLGVSYLFGFSFAFHDKARLFTTGAYLDHKEPALVMGNVAGAGPSTLPEPSPMPTRIKVATLTFDVGASLPNADSEEQLVNAVTVIQDKTNNDKAVRVLLIGGADVRQIESLAYQSNYELAEARAQNTKNLILERLSTSRSNVLRNLEWTCLAQPNEGLGKTSHHARRRVPANNEGKDDRTVQVFIIEAFESPAQLLVRNVRANYLKPLRLIDYVYFANYTITTTGYGDIVPNTTYAKFICSFANICEVLFLVVFFNALLSLAGAATLSSTAQKVNVLHEKWRNGPLNKDRDDAG